jgi:hypothetical protein
MSGNREAEPGPSTTNGAGASINSLHRKEALKDAREVGAVNANTVIDHGNLGTAVAKSINLELDSPALAAVLHSVMDEVRDGLAEAIAITCNQQRACADDIYATAMLRRHGGESLCNLLG